MQNDSMTDFQRERAATDAALVRDHGLRTRADVFGAAGLFDGDPHDVTSPAGRAADRFFCAAARHLGADVCSACETLTLRTEVTSYTNGPDLCDACNQHIRDAVAGLPAWVRDRDLPAILPELARAYVLTQRQEQRR